MDDIARSIARRGGLAATHELYSDGHTRGGVRAAAARGTILRVREGWFVLPDTPGEFIQVARIGGHLTCLSALPIHGLWKYPSRQTHVAVPPNSSRHHDLLDREKRLDTVSTPVLLHWRRRTRPSQPFVLDVKSSLADLVHCQPLEVAIVSAESAMHSRALSIGDWLKIVEGAPRRQQHALSLADGRCESGTESITFHRLRLHRLPIRPQVQIASVGRVDFLIGHRLVVEIDGREYHVDPRQFEEDRRRDARLSELGYRVLRFSYAQVMFDWSRVEGAILAAVFRGDHF